jgi:hypothetical protein
MSAPLTIGEQKALIAALTDQPAEEIMGFVAIAIREDGPVIKSNARDTPVIIEQLADVIAALAARLADGDEPVLRARGIRE